MGWTRTHERNTDFEPSSTFSLYIQDSISFGLLQSCHHFSSYICVYFRYSAKMGRVYLPQDELAQEGLSDEDIFAGKVTDKWRNFMKKQINRARMFYEEAEKGVSELSSASRRSVSIHSFLHLT